MQTIDPFRWALTGGYRVIDTASLTVLEKAWGTSQGGTNNFPDSSVSGNATVKEATPFSTAAGISTRIWSLGNKMRFMTSTTNTPAPNYGNTATSYNPSGNYQHGTLYEVFIRVKVCETSLGLDALESNCTLYGNGNYKPTGLMQQYADKIRYSAFGYLNDSRISSTSSCATAVSCAPSRSSSARPCRCRAGCPLSIQRPNGMRRRASC
jgi:type IV pilus assembly protein PilY1